MFLCVCTCRRRDIPARRGPSPLLFFHLYHSVGGPQEEPHPRGVCRPPSWIFPSLWNPWYALPSLQPQTPQICLYRSPEQPAADPRVQHCDWRGTHPGALKDRHRVVASNNCQRPPEATGGLPDNLPHSGQPGPGPIQEVWAGRPTSWLVHTGPPALFLLWSKRRSVRVTGEPDSRYGQGQFVRCWLRRESLHLGKDEVHAPQCAGPAAVQVPVQVWFQPGSCVSHPGQMSMTSVLFMSYLKLITHV